MTMRDDINNNDMTNANGHRDELRDIGNRASDLASDGYRVAKNTMQDTMDTLEQQSDELMDALADYVARKPITSIMVAAGIGWVLGKFWAR